MEFVTIEAQAERAVIAPEAGFQCLSYKVGALDIVAGPKDPAAEWSQHPFQTGIPILFPWPGRIKDGKFSYRGRDLEFPINDPRHNCAIHGLIYNQHFQVIRRGPFHVVGALDSRNSATLSKLWPFPFVLELDYQVGDGLRLRAIVTNVGNSPMPFGLGAHPYFHAPLDPQGTRAQMQIQGEVDRLWQTSEDRLLPTGELQTVSGRFDLTNPVTLGTETYDHPFTMTDKRGEIAARLIDPKLKMALELRASPQFRELVVYAPPGRDVVALEPYTCAPDAFNLSARNVAAGMLELQPGARFEASFEIRLSAP